MYSCKDSSSAPQSIDHYPDIKQLISERTAMISVNSYYRHQLADLELKISDLKAQLMAKDYEINLLTAKINSMSPQKPSLLYKSPSKSISPLRTSALFLEKQLKTPKMTTKPTRYKSPIANSPSFHIPTRFDTPKFDVRIKTLESVIKSLSEENATLRLHLFQIDSFGKTAKKETDSNKKTENKESSSEESASISNSTPRMESVVPELSKTCEFLCSFPKLTEFSPKPSEIAPTAKIEHISHSTNPKVRCISCDLSKISPTTVKPVKIAEFCPSSLRKLKFNNR
jgi:hypothetical protein